MEAQLLAWVCNAYLSSTTIVFYYTSMADFLSTVDLGGSLAVASKGLYATGVSTDLSGMAFLPGTLVWS